MLHLVFTVKLNQIVIQHLEPLALFLLLLHWMCKKKTFNQPTNQRQMSLCSTELRLD